MLDSNLFMTHKLLKRAALAALFCFILPSCSKPKLWHRNQICTKYPLYDSHILYYSPACRETSIGFELLTTCSGRYFYLHVYSIPLKYPCVEVSASCCNAPVQGQVLLGGQRVWLPNAFGEAILAVLQRGEFVTLKVGNYEHTLTFDPVSCDPE
jgi:hypothetical protein